MAFRIVTFIICFATTHTAAFIKKVLSVYTHSMTTIYLFLVHTRAEGTFWFRLEIIVMLNFGFLDRIGNLDTADFI